MLKRSALLNVEARFFFEPGQLGAQTADLGVQLGELPFVLGFPGFFALALILEQLRKVLQGLLPPAVQLVWMYPAFGGNLGNTFVFAEHFQNDLGFLIGCEVRFLGHSFSKTAP